MNLVHIFYIFQLHLIELISYFSIYGLTRTEALKQRKSPTEDEDPARNARIVIGPRLDRSHDIFELFMKKYTNDMSKYIRMF